jgi:hypothetical protein
VQWHHFMGLEKMNGIVEGVSKNDGVPEDDVVVSCYLYCIGAGYPCMWKCIQQDAHTTPSSLPTLKELWIFNFTPKQSTLAFSDILQYLNERLSRILSHSLFHSLCEVGI